MYITSKVSLDVTDTLQGRKQYFISEIRADALQITLQGNYNILSKGCEKFCIDSHNVILFSIPKSTLEDVLCSPKDNEYVLFSSLKCFRTEGQHYAQCACVCGMRNYATRVYPRKRLRVACAEVYRVECAQVYSVKYSSCASGFFPMASQKEGWYCTHFGLYRVQQHFKNSLENLSRVSEVIGSSPRVELTERLILLVFS